MELEVAILLYSHALNATKGNKTCVDYTNNTFDMYPYAENICSSKLFNLDKNGPLAFKNYLHIFYFDRLLS